MNKIFVYAVCLSGTAWDGSISMRTTLFVGFGAVGFGIAITVLVFITWKLIRKQCRKRDSYEAQASGFQSVVRVPLGVHQLLPMGTQEKYCSNIFLLKQIKQIT